MLRWLIAFLVLGLGSLVAARYLDGPHWVDALLASLLFGALAAGTALGAAIRGLAGRHWQVWAGLLVGVGAACGRFALLGWVLARPQATLRIAVPELAVAIGSVAWGALALVWGAWAIAEVPRGRRGLGALAVTSIALGLYSLAPLGFLLGLRVNHWTVLGLFGLAVVAYGVGRLYRLLTARG